MCVDEAVLELLSKFWCQLSNQQP